MFDYHLHVLLSKAHVMVYLMSRQSMAEMSFFQAEGTFSTNLLSTNAYERCLTCTILRPSVWSPMNLWGSPRDKKAGHELSWPWRRTFKNIKYETWLQVANVQVCCEFASSKSSSHSLQVVSLQVACLWVIAGLCWTSNLGSSILTCLPSFGTKVLLSPVVFLFWR